MEFFQIIIGLVLLAYALAELLGRWMALGALAWGNRAEPKIALTFDDGPSPQTEAILHILDKYQLKATFFLTGQNAEKHPELVEKLTQAGHQLEAHGYWHRPAIAMAPWTEWAHIQKSPGNLYRPPWGIHSPFTRLFAALGGKKVAMWDLESQDWLEKTPEELAARMLFYVKGGSVLLLHDGPERTLRLLEILLPQLLDNGYKPVRMDELSLKPLGPRQGIERVLQGPEEKYDLEHGCLKAGNRPNHILRLEPQSFPGPEIPGFPIGTQCLVLHFESARLAAMSPIMALRAARETFKETAKYVAAHPEIQFMYGASYLGGGLAALGFTTHPLPKNLELISKITTAWFAWVYRGEVSRHLWSEPAQIVYISREVLLEKYSGKESKV